MCLSICMLLCERWKSDADRLTRTDKPNLTTHTHDTTQKPEIRLENQSRTATKTSRQVHQPQVTKISRLDQAADRQTHRQKQPQRVSCCKNRPQRDTVNHAHTPKSTADRHTHARTYQPPRSKSAAKMTKIRRQDQPRTKRHTYIRARPSYINRQITSSS